VLERALLDSIHLINRGEYDAALPTLESERELTENNFQPNPYYYEAVAYLEAGEIDEALDLLDEAESRLDERPNENFASLVDLGFAQVYWRQAEIARAEGATAEADDLTEQTLERAQSAIDGDSRLALAYVLAARAQAAQGALPEALDTLDAALELDALRNNALLLLTKSELYFANGDYADADYQAYLALYIDPRLEQAHRLYVESALAQDEPGRAVERAQTYLFYFPGSVEAWRLLGDARAAEGNHDLALIAYSQALAAPETSDPQQVAAAFVARGNLYTQFRLPADALNDFNAALSLDPDPAVQRLRLYAALESGRFNTVESDVEALEGTRVLPGWEANLVRAQALIEEADAAGFGEGETSAYATALNLLVPLLGEGSQLPARLNPLANELVARAYLGQNNPDAALAAMELALARGSSDRDVLRYFLRGRIHEARNQFATAARDYQYVLALSRFVPNPYADEASARLTEISGQDNAPLPASST
jgi:tetratricopeptide (TPR) repeat protein